MSSYRKDLKKLCRDSGWKIAVTNGYHYRLIHPSGATVIAATSPSKPWVAMRTTRMLMRHALKERNHD